MDAGIILGFVFGYIATIVAVFLLFLPVVVLFVALLMAAGVLQLLLLPFVILIRKVRGSKPNTDMDGSWLMSPAER